MKRNLILLLAFTYMALGLVFAQPVKRETTSTPERVFMFRFSSSNERSFKEHYNVSANPRAKLLNEIDSQLDDIYSGKKTVYIVTFYTSSNTGDRLRMNGFMRNQYIKSIYGLDDDCYAAYCYFERCPGEPKDVSCAWVGPAGLRRSQVYEMAIDAPRLDANYEGSIYNRTRDAGQEPLKRRRTVTIYDEYVDPDVRTDEWGKTVISHKQQAVVPEEEAPVASVPRPAAVAEEAPRQEAPAPRRQESTVAPKKEAQAKKQVAIAALPSTASTYSPFVLKTNLLYWAALAPNLGVEYRYCYRWSIALEGAWTRWDWTQQKTTYRTYRFWSVGPELRYWAMGNDNTFKGLYLGLYAHAGEYNFKFSLTGKQSRFYGGGLSAGYAIHLNKHLDMDFGVGLGYIHSTPQSYVRKDGVIARTCSEVKNYIGPSKIKIGLIWKL